MATPRQDIGALSRSLNTSNALRGQEGRLSGQMQGRSSWGRLSKEMQGRGGGGRVTFGPNPPSYNPRMGQRGSKGRGGGRFGGGHRKSGRGVFARGRTYY